MKKRILEYRKKIDRLLEENDENVDWNSILQEHLVQIGFFQHERMIHLLVTLTFALLTMIALICTLVFQNIGMIILTLLFVCLLVPYIMHYYLLENEVQKMYEQYDRMMEKLR